MLPLTIASTTMMNDTNTPPASSVSPDIAPKERIDVINDFLQQRVTMTPLIGVVCGSGLGGLSECRQSDLLHRVPFVAVNATAHTHDADAVQVTKHQLSCVSLHSGAGKLRDVHVLDDLLVGEIRAMYLLGIKYLLVTNAAGGLNPDFNVGDLMILNDHLNMPGLSGHHPLIGPNDTRFGGRFIPLTSCYDEKLQSLALGVAEKLGLTHKVRRGVYCFVSGPTYETPTEARFLRLVGCDAVGMSTAPEAIVAAHCGLKTIGLSVITNKAVFPGEQAPAACHEEVIETIQATQNDIEAFVRDLIVAVGQQHRS